MTDPIEIEIETVKTIRTVSLVCDNCDANLSGELSDDGTTISVEPCDSCLEAARQEGRDEAADD